MTFKILTIDTKKIIHRSGIRTALDPAIPNLRALAGFGTTRSYVPTRFYVTSLRVITLLRVTVCTFPTYIKSTPVFVKYHPCPSHVGHT